MKSCTSLGESTHSYVVGSMLHQAAFVLWSRLHCEKMEKDGGGTSPLYMLLSP